MKGWLPEPTRVSPGIATAVSSRCTGDVVLGVDHYSFEEELETPKDAKGVCAGYRTRRRRLEELVAHYKERVEDELGTALPAGPARRSSGARSARVFGSWQTPRAITYRRLHEIPDEWGTAVNVQAMVFGNMGETAPPASPSPATRRPAQNVLRRISWSTPRARTWSPASARPSTLTVAGKATQSDLPAMEEVMPEVFGQLAGARHARTALPRHAGHRVHGPDRHALDAADPLGQAHATAAMRIAVEMVDEGLISRKRRSARSSPKRSTSCCTRRWTRMRSARACATGLPASPGGRRGSGLSADEAEAWRRRRDGHPGPHETSPEDIHGMHAAQGILTSRGGMTSHAAVVARGMGRPCVSGAGDIRIDYATGSSSSARYTIKAGRLITIDGAAARVMAGKVATIEPEAFRRFRDLDGLGRRHPRARVRANAETPATPRRARFGRRGHRALPDRTHVLRRRAHRRGARDDPGRARRAAAPLWKDPADAARRLCRTVPDHGGHAGHHPSCSTRRCMNSCRTDRTRCDAVPKAIRLHRKHLRTGRLRNQPPMLGHRGCRLGITIPRFTEMQARAIFEAARRSQEPRAEVARSDDPAGRRPR